MTVSDTFSSAAPTAYARPAADRPEVERVSSTDLESPEEIVARLERWVAAATASSALRTAATAPGPAVETAPAPPPTRKPKDDIFPSEPGWSAVLNEEVKPVGLATLACLMTLLAYAGLGLRNASCAAGGVLLIALIVGRNRDHSSLATRIIVGVAIGIAIACLS